MTRRVVAALAALDADTGLRPQLPAQRSPLLAGSAGCCLGCYVHCFTAPRQDVPFLLRQLVLSSYRLQAQRRARLAAKELGRPSLAAISYCDTTIVRTGVRALPLPRPLVLGLSRETHDHRREV